jgi:hypothetical protein
MIDYSIIDEPLIKWLQIKGYHIQTICRDDPVRSFLIWSEDHHNKVQIGVLEMDDINIKIGVYGGKRKRMEIKGKIADLHSVLNDAEAIALNWLR